jgi:hypothetical protein
MAVKAASGAAATSTTLDTNATIAAMHSMTEQGIAQTLATARDQLQLSLAAGLANIMKGVGSNIKSASQGG